MANPISNQPMKKIKAKAIKYAILMIVIFFLYISFWPALFFVCKLPDVIIPVEYFSTFYWLFFYLLNSAFAMILFLDCRKTVKNFVVIPLLSIFAPVVGVMFYFVATFLETRKQNL